MKQISISLIITVNLLIGCNKQAEISPIISPIVDLQQRPANQIIVKDIDGNKYHTIVIGTQTWMVENLKTTHYRDGSKIKNIRDSIKWYNYGNSLTGAYCDYDNKERKGGEYGRLYNWAAVDTSSGHYLAPKGWHIPSAEEWYRLVAYLDPTIGGGCLGCAVSNIAGGAMKDTTDWLSPNTGAINSSGFTALPGGSRGSTFGNIGNFGYFWSSALYNTNGFAWFMYLSYDNSEVYILPGGVINGYSVRCVKD